MYQDKIAEKVKQVLETRLENSQAKNIFLTAGLIPLDLPEIDEALDAVYIASDILCERSNDDVIKITNQVSSLLPIGRDLLVDMHLKMSKEFPERTITSLSEGRSLYILSGYFDLKEIGVENLQWDELFATLALMQVAQVISAKNRKYNDDPLSQDMKQYVPHFISQMQEQIVDTIARAECLHDMRLSKKMWAKRGGETRGASVKPLKELVVKLYIEHYSALNNKRAGEEISAKLDREDNRLRYTSSAENRALQFSRWIGIYKKQVKNTD